MDKLSTYNWKKDWEGRFSLFATHLTIRGYFNPMLEIFDTCFKNVLITHQKGITAGYLLDEDLREFGSDLVKKVNVNENILLEWTESFKLVVGDLRNIFQLPVVDFFSSENSLKLLEQKLKKFTSYQIALKEVVNHLSESIDKGIVLKIEESRKCSESLFIEIDKYELEIQTQIARKEGYRLEQISCLSDLELKDYLNGHPLPQKTSLDKRYQNSGFLFFPNKEQEIFLEELLSFENRKIVDMLIKGKTAFSGQVKGICRVVKDYRDVEFFNEGDILVTGMTDPDFVSTIKRAGAIITDAGGALSHAAIIARELGIPCIVGTQNATKALKDGDEVEVDADRGIVTILKKVDE